MASIVLAAAMVLSALVVVMPTMAEDVETNLKVVEPQIFALDMSITSAEDFVGTWTNADLESGRMIKFVITQEDSEYYFRGYGACHPTPCDWGTTPLTLYSKSVSDTNDIAGTAEYDSGFKETRIYLVMLNPYVIMAYNFDKFTDASGRHNYASMECFTKVVVPESTLTPKTHSTGLLTISQTWTADLDEGEVGAGADSDIWFQAATATERYITPRNGATIAKVGTTSVGLGGCMEAPLSSSRININDLPEGTYVCVRTNLGRYSQFRVNEPVGPSPGTLNIGYTTWEAIP